MNGNPDGLYLAGLDALVRGDLAESQRYIETLISQGNLSGLELRAWLQIQSGAHEEALVTLQEVVRLMATGSPERLRQAYVMRIRFMVQVGLLDEIEAHSLQQEKFQPSMLLGTAADECLAQGDRVACRRFALVAARMDHDDDGALWYLREADKVRSAGAKMRKLLVGGHLEIMEKYCAVQHHVVSDSVEQALDFVRELEPGIFNLKLEKVLEETARPDLPWGVYWRGPWVTTSAS